MSRHRLPVISGIVFLVCAVIAAVVLLSGGDNTPKQAAAKGDKIASTFTQVPLNHATGSGDVDVRLDGRVATVTVHARGLLDNAAHAMHFHAGAVGKCPDRSAGKLHNNKRVIAAHDGGPFYGPPVTSLTTRGDTSGDSVVAFARFPHTGKITYHRKIRVSAVVASQLRKNNAVAVIHGVDYNHNGLYDNSLDRSDINKSLPGESTLPDLCGPLRISRKAGSSGDDKASAGVLEFHARLAPQRGGPTLVADSTGPAWRWLCTLHGTVGATL